jgi:benzylsuccinate CoA-transferase BbsF subunit
MTHFLGPALLDYVVNNRKQKPVGNRSPYAAPHNVFRCKGEDRWCVIAVFTDEEWESFCTRLDKAEWINDPKFTSLTARKESEDELDGLIGEWTRQYTPQEVMTELQAVGVPAGIVQNAEDIVEFDPQVKARELLPKRRHPVIGEFLHTRWPFILSETPNVINTTPCLGEHNWTICKDILGMTDEEYIEFETAGVLS